MAHQGAETCRMAKKMKTFLGLVVIHNIIEIQQHNWIHFIKIFAVNQARIINR
jgi:hypothetical protein